MSHPRVAIIYLCWGMRDYLKPVVEAVSRQTYPHESLKLFLVPAGSKDGIQDEIRSDVLSRSKQDLPETVMIDVPENQGFAGNNNVAVLQALEEGFDYVFLHNGDLELHPDTIQELVRVAESDESIASVQPVVLYANDHEKVNTSGGIFHVAGYGYARDNLKSLSDISYEDGSEVAYTTGAASLYRASALRHVGLMEEGFFMYHEDLELGLRFKMAGYKNVLATNARAYHDYQFSRNKKMFAWMELYRWVVIKAYYKVPTLLLLAPLLLCIEMGTWIMAFAGGWVGAKGYMVKEAFRPKTWKLLWNMRKRAQTLRTVPDRELLTLVSGRIEAQEQHNWIVERLANPIIDLCLRFTKTLVRW